jgi:hypothetical protein
VRSTKQKIGIKMFSWDIYGRVMWKNGEDAELRKQKYGCYGNWELVLAWQDSLQGKITHEIGSIAVFGEKGPFYLTICIEGEPIYCSLMKANNLIG